jgi:hypothetical protein
LRLQPSPTVTGCSTTTRTPAGRRTWLLHGPSHRSVVLRAGGPCEPSPGVTDFKAYLKASGYPVRGEPWPTDALFRPALRPSSALNTYVHPGVLCSSRIIQLTPNRSLTCSRADAAEQLSDYALTRPVAQLLVTPSPQGSVNRLVHLSETTVLIAAAKDSPLQGKRPIKKDKSGRDD